MVFLNALFAIIHVLYDFFVNYLFVFFVVFLLLIYSCLFALFVVLINLCFLSVGIRVVRGSYLFVEYVLFVVLL